MEVVAFESTGLPFDGHMDVVALSLGDGGDGGQGRSTRSDGGFLLVGWSFPPGVLGVSAEHRDWSWLQSQPCSECSCTGSLCWCTRTMGVAVAYMEADATSRDVDEGVPELALGSLMA